MEIYVATQSPKMRIILVIVRQDTLKINKHRENTTIQIIKWYRGGSQREQPVPFCFSAISCYVSVSLPRLSTSFHQEHVPVAFLNPLKMQFLKIP